MPTKTESKTEVPEVLATIESTTDFARALKNAYLFTLGGRDAYRSPALSCVEISFLDGQVVIVATDSYALMTETINVESAKPAEAVTIHRDQVKQIIDALKGAHAASVTIKPDAVASCKIQGANGNSIFETLGTKVAFPDWRRIIDNGEPTGQDGVIGYAPKQVARLAKIDGGSVNAPLRFEFYGATKPMRVTVGKTVAYQMPFRLS